MEASTPGPDDRRDRTVRWNAMSIGAAHRGSKQPGARRGSLPGAIIRVGFRMTALAIAMLAFFAPSHAVASRTVGLFMLYNVDARLDTASLQRPYIRGLALQLGWRHIEPSEGVFDWSQVDRAFEAARAAGKLVSLHLLPGRPPEWLSRSGVQTYSRQLANRSDPRYGQAIIEPLGWDPVFLEKWGNVVKRLGARYGRHPSLFAVGVTAPYSEMVIKGSFPLHSETSRNLRQLYRRDVYLRAWRNMIDVYGEAFPGKAIFVAPGVVFDDAYFADEVMSYAFLRFADNLWAFNAGLRAVFPTRNPQMEHIYSLLSQYAERANLGFQMIWSQSGDRANQLQGSLRESLMNGIRHGAGYMEVYQADVRNPSLQEDLRYVAGVLHSTPARAGARR